MHQFNAPNKKKGKVVYDATWELQELASDIEGKDLHNNVEGWVDEQDEMDIDMLMALDDDI